MRATNADSIDLTALFEEHRDGLAGAVRGTLGRGADVQEVLQEAFLKSFRAQSEGRLRGDPLGFIFVVTLNLARDLRRKNSRRDRDKSLEEVPDMELRSTEALPTVRAEHDEAIAAARDAIGRLPDGAKEVFFLRVNAELSFEAVADTLGIPVGTAKTRMRAALGELRRTLAPHSPAPHAPTLPPGREL